MGESSAASGLRDKKNVAGAAVRGSRGGDGGSNDGLRGKADRSGDGRIVQTYVELGVHRFDVWELSWRTNDGRGWSYHRAYVSLSRDDHLQIYNAEITAITDAPASKDVF